MKAETVGLMPALMQSVFGSRARVRHVDSLHRVPDYQILRIELDQRERGLIVKLAGPDAPLPCPFEQTAQLHTWMRERTTLPIAEIYAADESYARWPWRYSVQAALEGLPWSVVRPQLDEAALDDAYTQLGDAVAVLHGLRLPAFGDTNQQWVTRNYVAALTHRAETIIQNPHWRHLFLEVLETHRTMFESVSAPCVVHDDLHHGNLLFARQGEQCVLSGILDFDKTWAGHAESDLARLALWRGQTAPAFWKAYTRQHSLDAGFEERRPVYQLLWCLEYAVDTPQHLADTAAVCAELGIAPIVAFNA